MADATGKGWPAHFWKEYSAYSISPNEHNVKLLTVLSRGGTPTLPSHIRDRVKQELLPEIRHRCILHPQGSLHNLGRVGYPSTKVPTLQDQANAVMPVSLPQLESVLHGSSDTTVAASLPAGMHCCLASITP